MRVAADSTQGAGVHAWSLDLADRSPIAIMLERMMSLFGRLASWQPQENDKSQDEYFGRRARRLHHTAGGRGLTAFEKVGTWPGNGSMGGEGGCV